jgi:16S rRNA (cytosine1402-N4)-methyltransferase
LTGPQHVETGHAPVLLVESVAALSIRPDGVYLDATYGRGGHSREILRQLAASGRLLCLDRDPLAIDAARAALGADPRVAIFLAPFSALAACADGVSPGLRLDGILFDLGVSSPQLDDPARGFSFMHDGPLDMRMGEGCSMSAADFVNGATEGELVRVFRDYGEERFAGRIARAIVADRQQRPFLRTLELAELIARVSPTHDRHKHPATRVFQALRIRINDELGELERALDAAMSRLQPHGRLVVISFHSLEDRIVKQFMRRHSLADPMYAGLPHIPPHARPTLRTVGKQVAPAALEADRNPRARSARLRVAERLGGELAA